MKIHHALILAILLTGLIASNVYVFSQISSDMGERQTALVARVIDGDTLVLEDGRHIRLSNINSPEKDVSFSIQATSFLKSFENKSVELEILGIDKYSRSLARIYAPDYINLKLVSLGLASKFLVQEDELKLFSEAEETAISQSRGIWNKSIYFNCFSSEINQFDEIVILKNKCSDINLKDWQLKDESRKIYKFPDITIGEIKIHTENGNNNSTDLFWNSAVSVWNNDRDSLYLFDSQERIVHYEAYGY